MPATPRHPLSETRSRRKLWWQFGLKSLFVLLTFAGWCTWQWTITRQRQASIVELHAHYIPTFHDSVVSERSAHAICTSIQWTDDRVEEPIRPGLVASLTGWENRRGLTVFIETGRFHPRLPLNDQLDHLRALFSLPGLTTVILWDANPDSEKWGIITEFKDAVKSRLPHVEIKHIHVEPPPVG